MRAGTRDVERLEDRLTEWTEDGTLPPDAAAAIAAVLATAANEATTSEAAERMAARPDTVLNRSRRPAARRH